jgi:uncharacterized protein YndB with AHSA1/START domain
MRISSSTSASAGGNAAGGTAPDGRAYSYEALFQDIVPAERIVYTYEMLLEGTRISVSLATVEFTPVGDSGTGLVFTEQGGFLDGHESPARRAEGMGSLLDALGEELQSETPGG